MIELPTIGGDVSILEAGLAIAIFVTGYAIHEVLHILPLKLLGHEYSVELFPIANGRPGLRTILFEPIVSVTMLDNPPRSHVALSALAPGIMTIFPVTALALALLHPVLDIGTLLIIVAWFVVTIPSTTDWLAIFQYQPDESNTTEVTHG